MIQVLASRVLLRPRDYDRTVAFYRDQVGLPIYREFPGGTVFFLGGGFLEVTGHGTEEPSDAVRLWLQVPDAGEAERALRQAGVVIEEAAETKPWGLVEAVARDPDGVALVLVEVPPDHPLRRDARVPQP